MSRLKIAVTALLILALTAAVSFVVSKSTQYPFYLLFSSLTIIGAAISIATVLTSNQASNEDTVAEKLYEFQDQSLLEKEDLRELGLEGTLSVYASDRAAETYYQLSKDEKEHIEDRLRSISRGGVDDVSSRPNAGRLFINATPMFDINFEIVSEKPGGSEILNISNQESETDVGVYVVSIVGRKNRRQATT
ncbi:hypothetical protein [Haloarchaeobius salinus]|uniref:hypothetical protein n=1 Tax=Haloarchaeobius salinus TaxID=1198298 RepID=UPI002108B825|nr:hypothetical protein [Haloarchaeobius salinus]